jgi:hypothetical protein
MWQERNERGVEGNPPCGTCRVDLREENRPVADIFLLCRGQLIFRNNGEYDTIIDISLPTIFQAIDTYPEAITNKWKCASRIRKLFFRLKEKNED